MAGIKLKAAAPNVTARKTPAGATTETTSFTGTRKDEPTPCDCWYALWPWRTRLELPSRPGEADAALGTKRLRRKFLVLLMVCGKKSRCGRYNEQEGRRSPLENPPLEWGRERERIGSIGEGGRGIVFYRRLPVLSGTSARWGLTLLLIDQTLSFVLMGFFCSFWWWLAWWLNPGKGWSELGDQK